MSYDGEICQGCGFPVAHFVRSWWQASDDLWIEVVGHGGGILCPPCFTLAASDQGIRVRWEAVEDSRAALAGSAGQEQA